MSRSGRSARRVYTACMRRVWKTGVALVTLVVMSSGAVVGQTLPPESPAAPSLSPELRQRFTAAVQQYRAGDWKGAAPAFGELGGAATPIPDYALYLQADSLTRLGDAEAAAAAATQAADRLPDGPIATLALLLAGEQASRAGKGAEAVALLRRFMERHPDHGEVTRGRFMLAQALESSGLTADAAALYRQIWIRAPASPFADPASAAERALASRGVTLPPLAMRERLERAERLLAGGRADTARAEAEVLASEGSEPESKLRALKVVAEAARRTGRHDLAARAVDQALAVAVGPARAAWLLERARLQQRQNRDGALAVLRQVVQEHPRAPEAPDALALSARLLEEAGRGPEAEAVYLRVAAEYADGGEAGAALWRLGWIAWQRGAPAEAAERWGRVFKVRGGQAYRDPATYWIGRAHEVRGEREAAERQYATLAGEAARTYYGVLAAARLTGRPPAASSSAARPASARPPVTFPGDPVEPLRADPVYWRVDALRAVGLAEFVEGEVDGIARRAAGDPVRLYSVAAVHVEDARYHLAIRILRRAFFQEARAGDSALPRPFWEMLYPLGWRASLEAAASRATVDPLLVAAVAREESSFHPKARSPVGARGLMQLMPDTARPMARQRGLEFRGGDVLDDPAANLDMGASYLAGLVRTFGEARLAVAAYNAGPGRVRQWLAAGRPDDMEAWVELIPFDETRGFVKRVMLSWDEYRRLYPPRP
jgi:soluble lytic murein transglycosylase